jgi:hypothetical protein
MPNDAGKRLRNVSWWVLLGGIACCLVVMSDAGSLLGSVRDANNHGYTANVFTGLHFQVDDYRAALATWRSVSPRVFVAHLIADLIFILLYSGSLRRVFDTKSTKPPFKAIHVLVAFDLVETILAFKINISPTPKWVMVTHAWICGGKWLAVVAVTLTFVAVHLNQQNSRASSTWTILRNCKRQLVFISVFGLLVAMPPGGSLSQVPDIVRAELENFWSLRTVAVLAGPALLAASIVVSARLTLPTNRSPTQVGTGVLLLISVLMLILIGLVEVLFDRTSWVPMAPLIVVVGSVVVLRLLNRFEELDEHQKMLRPLTLRVLTTANDADFAERNRVLGALAAAVIALTGIGLVRSASPLVLLNLAGAAGWVEFFSGIVVATGGAFVTQHLVGRILGRSGVVGFRSTRLSLARFCFGMTTSVVVAIGIFLAAKPELAGVLGATAVLCIALSNVTIGLGALAWLTRSGLHWNSFNRLGFQRSPWGALLALTYLVVSLMNQRGEYHRIDFHKAEPLIDGNNVSTTTPGKTETMSQALSKWSKQNSDSKCDGPLVVVAAAGGGIRAAAFTGYALETLFQGKCRKISCLRSRVNPAVLSVQRIGASTEMLSGSKGWRVKTH